MPSVCLWKTVFSAKHKQPWASVGTGGLFLPSLRANEVCYFWGQKAVLWETSVKFMGMQLQDNTSQPTPGHVWHGCGPDLGQCYSDEINGPRAEQNESGV